MSASYNSTFPPFDINLSALCLILIPFGLSGCYMCACTCTCISVSDSPARVLLVLLVLQYTAQGPLISKLCLTYAAPYGGDDMYMYEFFWAGEEAAGEGGRKVGERNAEATRKKGGKRL